MSRPNHSNILLLGHIIRQDASWENAHIRVLRVLEIEEGRRGAEEDIVHRLSRLNFLHIREIC